MVELNFFAAFMIGLIGASHCVGMCGGIAAAITVGISGTKNQSRWLYLVYYNLGRIGAYLCIGWIFGMMFTSLSNIYSHNILIIFRFISALMMILLGLYISKWWTGLTYIEQGGRYIWRYISPLTRYFLPLASPIKAIPLGFIWGWLPCGLVYSTLTWAAISGSGVNGALIMLGFGLGTLPIMLTFGVLADKLTAIVKNAYIKQISGSLLIIYGAHTGYIAINQIWSGF